jgi:hypothetical protein
MRGLMLILDEKRGKLLRRVPLKSYVRSRRTNTRGGVEGIKGRMLHYSACMHHLRVSATELALRAGPVEEEAYNGPRQTSRAILRLAAR